MRGRLIAGLAAAALLTIPVTMTAGRADANDASRTDAYVSDFAEYLGFVGGVPLNPLQRQLVAEQTAADLRANPGSVASTDETVRKLLPKLNAGDASAVAERRETFRLQIALVPPTNVGRVVVERNDPTVVFDEKHHRIITERSLAALQRACVWTAGVLGVSGPDANFVATQRTFFHDHYDQLTNEQQETLAHTERDLPLLISAYDKAGSAKQVEFVKAVKAYPHEGPRLAPLTVALMGAVRTAVDTKSVDDSIVLMGAMNNTMLFHAGYYH